MLFNILFYSGSLGFFIIRLLAQWIESWSSKPVVGSSSLSEPATICLVSLMGEPRSYKAMTEVRFFHKAPNNGIISVMVAPEFVELVARDRYSYDTPMADSTGVRPGLINPGDWLDGLERLGS